MRKLLKLFILGPTADEVIDSTVVVLRDIQARSNREVDAYDEEVGKLVIKSHEAMQEASQADAAAHSLELLKQR